MEGRTCPSSASPRPFPCKSRVWQHSGASRHVVSEHQRFFLRLIFRVQSPLIIAPTYQSFGWRSILVTYAIYLEVRLGIFLFLLNTRLEVCFYFVVQRKVFCNEHNFMKSKMIIQTLTFLINKRGSEAAKSIQQKPFGTKLKIKTYISK